MDRRLTARGRALSLRMGAYLKASNATPDLALISPALRTIETMDEIERGLARDLNRAVALPLYNAATTTLLALVAETPQPVRVLLVVGHNPGLAETANTLSKKGAVADLARLRTQFPAPSLADIVFDGDDWKTACQERGRLDRFITPAVLEKLGEGA